ncbi:hypothetical protein BST61_g4263 [Cercospora zeina]
MSSHKQIDVTKDIMQQLPGELVAHIASYAGKKELNNLRLASYVTEQKSNIEFAKQSLRPLRINLRVDKGGLGEENTTSLDRFDCSDIEAAIKFIDRNDRSNFVQDVVIRDVVDYRKFSEFQCCTKPLSPSEDIGSSEAAKLLNTFFSKLTSLRNVSLCLGWQPSIALIMHVLSCQPQLRLTSLTISHGWFSNVGVISPVLSLFKQSLRSLHFTRTGMSRRAWRKLFEHIRDDLQIEDFTDERWIATPQGKDLIGHLTYSKDVSPNDLQTESYLIAPLLTSVVMKGRLGVKMGAEKMLELVEPVWCD